MQPFKTSNEKCVFTPHPPDQAYPHMIRPRPQSSRRHSVWENDHLAYTHPISVADCDEGGDLNRPTSSSLNRYTTLPPIGSFLDQHDDEKPNDSTEKHSPRRVSRTSSSDDKAKERTAHSRSSPDDTRNSASLRKLSLDTGDDERPVERYEMSHETEKVVRDCKHWKEGGVSRSPDAVLHCVPYSIEIHEQVADKTSTRSNEDVQQERIDDASRLCTSRLSTSCLSTSCLSDDLNTERPQKSCDASSFPIRSRPETKACRDLAVKLPDGVRLEVSVDPSHTLQSLLHYIHRRFTVDLEGHSIVADFPRRVFHDKLMTFKQCGIEDKSVIYLEKD